jgi:ABC-type branched-subunit amino acid transport system ATPase component
MRHKLLVAAGETVLLVGANGAGKSSTINAIIGLAHTAGDRLFSRGAAGFPTMSVTDNVLTGAFGLGRKHQREALDWPQATFPLLRERAMQPAGQLSGGQQQIVALARAMASFPTLLLLDEPFLGLAPVWIKQISNAILHLREHGTTVLMTEQMARPALRLATSGYVMRTGEVRRGGKIAEIRDVALAEEYL